MGDREAALELLRRSVSLDPLAVDARCDLGLMLHWLGAHTEAAKELREAIAVDPGRDIAHANLALALIAVGDAQGAERSFRQALACNSTNVACRANLARLYLQIGRTGESLAELELAIAAMPRDRSLWDLRGSVHAARGEWVSAELCYREALKLEARHPSTLSNLGFALAKQGRYSEAKTACKDAVALQPDSPEVLVNFAIVLEADGEIEPCIQLCRRALELNPRHAAAQLTWGNAERARGAIESALAHFRRSHELDPNPASTRYNLATAMIQTGDYAEGFALLESRFEAFPSAYTESMRSVWAQSERRWTGGSVRGKRLLVWAEQGFGDTIMMSRYLPGLGELGALVTVACPDELARLLRTLPGQHCVIGLSDVAAFEYDLHCPMLSLPNCFETTPSQVPLAQGYFAVEHRDRDHWAERLRDCRGFRVGIVWAGNTALRDDARRSIPPECFTVLGDVSGISLINLQRDASREQLERLRFPAFDPMGNCLDFYDTACVIANLDLVVSVDTAVAHLSGALGRPVWMLDRVGSEWRWGVSGEQTPWYSSMRLIRQTPGVCWQALLADASEDLRRIVESQDVRSTQDRRPPGSSVLVVGE